MPGRLVGSHEMESNSLGPVLRPSPGNRSFHTPQFSYPLVFSTLIGRGLERQLPEPRRGIAGTQIAAVELEAVGRGAAWAGVLVEERRRPFVRCGSRGPAEAVAR